MLARLPLLTPFFLALRNMRTRLGRTSLTLAGIVLGVAVVLAIQITNQSTLDSIRRMFDRAVGQAHLLVVPNSQGGQALDETLSSLPGKFPGVQLAAPSLMVQTLLSSEAESWQIAFSINGIAAGNVLHLYGVDPELDPQVRLYVLTAGRLPEPERYQAVLPEKYAVEKNLEIGEDLVLLAPQGEERLEIVGLLADEGVGLLNGGVVAFAPLEVVQEIYARGGELDEIAIRAETALGEDLRALEQMKNSLAERIGKDGRVIYPSARGQLVTQMLGTYQQGLAFFSSIALFVGAFLIYNTFSMTVVERTREIGMLRAIGMNRFQVLRMVLAEAVLLSLAGALLGVAGGIFLARGLIVLMGAVVSSSENVISLTWQAIAQSVMVGMGVTLGAAFFPSLQAARISPLEALRAHSRSLRGARPAIWLGGLLLLGLGWLGMYRLEWREGLRFQAGSASVLAIMLGATLTVSLAVVTLEGLTRPFSAILYGNAGALGSSNVRRSIGRTTLTVASLMIALIMIIGVGSLAFSFEEDMLSWTDTALGGDLYVRSPLTMRDSFGRQLESLPGVAAVTPARYLDIRLDPASLPPSLKEEDTLYYAAIDPQSYRRVSEIEFVAGGGDPDENWARFARGEAIFISNVVADRYGLKRGDRLTLLTRRGAHAFEVAAVMVDFTGQGFIIYGSYADLKRWFGESGANRFTLRVAPGYSASQVAEEIEARYGARRHISVESTQNFKENVLTLMRSSFQMFDVLNLIAVIVGALGVINTLVMNVWERQREIGGLRSLGMTRGQVTRMVLAESLAMGLIGSAYGLAFGYVVAEVLIMGMNLLNGYDLVHIFTPRPYLVGVLIALVISQVAALYPARQAARVNIVEAIKHE